MSTNTNPQIAKRYAQALFASVPEGTRSQVSEEFKQVLKVLEDPDIQRAFTHPRTSLDRKEKLIRLMQLSDVMENFLLLVVEKSREPWLAHMEEEFELLVLSSQQTTIAEVTSAVHLKEEALADLKKKLGKLTGKTVLIRTNVDPLIGGGMIIKVDGKIIDASVKNTLRQLQRKLSS